MNGVWVKVSDWLKIKLVPGWQSAWKWISMQLIALAGTVQLSVLAFPDTMKTWLTDKETHYIALFLLVAAVLGRLVAQPPKA